ncbi:MAG: hypothetical protein Q6373_003455, partial [Candidatus Sigynarchaeota archaeon]
MSTETRAFILREMRDVEVVIESIKRLSKSFTRKENLIEVSNGVRLEINVAGVVAKFEEPHFGEVPEKNRFIKELQETYPLVMQEKIERLRKELAATQEKEALVRVHEEAQTEAAERKRRISEMERTTFEAMDQSKIAHYEAIGLEKRAEDLKRKRELARQESIVNAEK